MGELWRSITKKEWRLVALLAGILIVITAIPYLYGYLTTPDAMVYTGVHYLTPGDTNVMLSNIEQVKQGHLVFINPYTAEPQHRWLMNPLWLSIGLMAKIFSMPNLLAYHVARSIWIIIFLVVVYLLMSYMISDARRRQWTLMVLVAASGVGLFFNPFLFDLNKIYEHPTDTWVPESVTFLTLYHSPHLIASLTLIILTFLLMLLAFDTNRWRYTLWAGVACLFLLWFHPFNGPTIFAVLGVYMLIMFFRQRKIVWSYVKHYAVLCLFPIPVVVYMYWMSHNDWVIRMWNQQNILPSPSVWMYLIGYGLLVPLALYGLWITRKKLDNKGVFLVIWLCTSALLVYFPIYFQRRMIEGFHVPLTLFAALGLVALADRLRDPRPHSWQLKLSVLVTFCAIFLPLSNVQIMGQDIFKYQTTKEYPYYLPQGDIEAMRWLKENTTDDDVIFSTYEIGNFIPAYSGRTVWIGHGPQTINLEDKYVQSAWFWWDDDVNATKRQWLIDQRVTYVWYGSNEKSAGQFNPDTKAYLQKVFSNADVSLYRVQ